MGHHQLTTVEPLENGSVLAGRYRILAKVGEGGFGMVYKARDTRHRDRLVAIKEIDLGALSPRQIIEATDSYNREVTLLSRTSHPHMPRMYDHFTDPTHWYLVMQYIEGETLEDYLKQAQGGHLPVKEVLAVGIQLSRVLGYLHSCRIIYRDVKPANIMRTYRGRLYLIDFGIARRFSPDKARDTGPLGSPGYAAPEQYGKAQSTEQTDIYGLGATLQTLLTGREPLDDEPAAPPVTKPPDRTIQHLRQLLDAMQATNAADRPRHMQEVRQRLLALRQRYPKRQAFSFLIGLLIGSVPWIFPPLYTFISNSLTNGGTTISGLLNILNAFAAPMVLLFYFWPLVLISQCLLATYFILGRPRRLLMAFGMLIMLMFIFLAFRSGWFPPVNLF